MFGIQREWVKEILKEYKSLYPLDTRDDCILIKHLMDIRKPEIYNRYLKKWMFRQVFEDNKE